MVENLLKNCRIAMQRKKLTRSLRTLLLCYEKRGRTYTFATRLNCSNRFLGMKVRMVYFDVMTWFVAYW